MTTDSGQSAQSVLLRLERLERTKRFYMTALALLVSIGIGVLLMAAAPSAGVVRASSVVLVDDDGRMRAELGLANQLMGVAGGSKGRPWADAFAAFL
jgi:hypothetical protein